MEKETSVSTGFNVLIVVRRSPGDGKQKTAQLARVFDDIGPAVFPVGTSVYVGRSVQRAIAKIVISPFRDDLGICIEHFLQGIIVNSVSRFDELIADAEADAWYRYREQDGDVFPADVPLVELSA